MVNLDKFFLAGIRFLLPIAAVIFLTACQTTNTGFDTNSESNVIFRTQLKEDAKLTMDQSPTLEVFKPGDTVSMNILGVEDTEGDFIVNSAGFVDFPIIGERKVAGNTAEEVQKALKQVYGTSYFVNPTVIITREAAPIGQIVIDGFVNEPGIHELSRNITLSHAIAMVGGLSEDANASRVIVARVSGDERIGLQYNLNGIREEGFSDPIILPGDVIYVDDDKRKIYWREVLRTSPLILLFTRL